MNPFAETEFSSILLIAQDGSDDVPALVGGGEEIIVTEEGADGGSQAAPPAAGGGIDMLVLLIPVVFLFLFMIFSTNRKDKKRREQLQKIVKHDRVRTRGGIIGSVVDADGDTLVIKVDEGRDTRITLDRQYVDAILEGAGSGKD